MKESVFWTLCLGGIVLLFVIYWFLIPMYHKSFELEISAEEARRHPFHLIVDVRTPQEREEYGYYPNSIPVSMDHLRTEIPMDVSNRSSEILVYSNGHDSRAAAAAYELYDMGYTRVRYLKGDYQQMLPPGLAGGLAG